jgi:hypothetical protein
VLLQCGHYLLDGALVVQVQRHIRQIDGQVAENLLGLVVSQPTGEKYEAGWAVGTTATVDWVAAHAEDDTLVFIDAPLM